MLAFLCSKRWYFFGLVMGIGGLWLAGCAPAPYLDTSPTSSLDVTPTAVPPFTDYTGRLAFAAGDDLYAANADGSNVVLLAHESQYEGMPAWSPDGKYIAFVSFRDANEEIYVGPPDALDDLSKAVNLTQHVAQDHAPAWAPDGTRIAFVSNRDGAWGIFVMPILITEDERVAPAMHPIRLTYNIRYDGHPAWAPDSTRIAYTSDRGYRWEIMVTLPNGSDQMAFPGLSHLGSTIHPAWSPDGMRLAFASNNGGLTSDGNWQIYVAGLDGSEPIRLTSHPAVDCLPSWTPDGAWITFLSSRNANWDIYIVKADGSALYRLTDWPGVELSPAWQP